MANLLLGLFPKEKKQNRKRKNKKEPNKKPNGDKKSLLGSSKIPPRQLSLPYARPALQMRSNVETIANESL